MMLSELCQPFTRAGNLSLENLLDEFLAAKDLKLFRFLAGADELRSDIQFFLDSDRHSSLS